MSTFEFIVALARDAGTPFAVAVAALAAMVAVPIIVGGLRRSQDHRHEVTANRDIDIKRIEASVRNGSVALTKQRREDDYG